MHDDEMMDRLLKDVMAGDPPQLSAGFDAGVMQRVRPRRLTTIGRAVLAIYIVAAAVATVWLMRGLDVRLIAGSLVVGVSVAAAVSAYLRRLTFGH